MNSDTSCSAAVMSIVTVLLPADREDPRANPTPAQGYRLSSEAL
jgi:hypothetical protein